MAKKQKIKEVAEAANQLPEILIVSPKECIGQEKNARYFMPEVFQQLVDNIKKDGRLESTPLVYRDKDKLRIISGHHRIEAAIQAGLEKIVVMVIQPKDKNEIISKQLSHNALVGTDDKMIIKELFQAITDMNDKIASGISSDVNKINYASLNFRIGTFKEFIIMFIPSEVNRYDEILDEVIKYSGMKPSSEVRIAPIEYYDKFADTIRKVKKINNIKSNSIALKFILDITEEWITKKMEKDVENKVR